MQVLTPSRLIMARHRRGMTLQQVGRAAGVTAPAVSQFEAGVRSPTSETLARLADALGYPVSFLVADDVELIEAADGRNSASSAASFRSLRSLTARNRARALSVGVLAVEFFDLLESRLKTPQVDLPDLAEEGPTGAASLLRGMWQLGEGPIDNMVHLLEAKGVRLFYSRAEVHEVDAFAFWRNNRPYVMLGAHKTAERSRRDAAHELAHLVLHRSADLCSQVAEQQAEAFASEFLLPRDQFLQECPLEPTRERFAALKRRWKVSRASLIRRAFDLGRISEWRYRSEFIEMSQRGRDVEDDPLAREESLLFAKMLPMLMQAGLGLDVLAQQIHVPVEELDNLVPVLNPERWRTNTPARARPTLRLVGE